MPRRDEALASMRDALQIQDPEWDIAPGSPEWKILEAAAQQIENVTFNSVLNDFHFDVDKKSGLELDLFMSLFGYSRIRARRATGEVTFSRGTPATQDYIISLGTQVFVPATAFSPAIYFQTTISAVLPTGATEVSVPVQAVVGGTTGNVGSGSITGLATSVGGITAVFNVQAISGGRDFESDSDLRDRWRATVFRNISGTEDQFLGLAYNETGFVTRANLVGPIERYSEQVQLQAPYDLTTASPWAGTLNDAGGGLDTSETGVTLTSGHGDRFPVVTVNDEPFYIGLFAGGQYKEIMQVVTRSAGSDTLTVSSRSGYGVTHTDGDAVRQVFPSSVTDSKYTYPPGGEIVGLDIGLTTQQVGRRGSDYYLITDRDGIPHHAEAIFPLLYVTAVGATNFGLDSIIEMESEYTPLSSRNDPENQVAEKVDMFVDGEDALSVVEQVPMRHDKIFGTDVSQSQFLRDDGVTHPIVGNFYTQLSKAPIISVPTSITVAATETTAATTYYKDEDYFLVGHDDDDDGFAGSPRASNGLEWNFPTSTDFSSQTPTFATTLTATAGKLDAYYSYVVTYEIDGIESTPSDPEHTSTLNVAASSGRTNIVLPTSDAVGATTIWRKVYRSLASEAFAESDVGPFYLLKIVKNNTSTAFEDNKADSALNLNVRPPQDAPPVDAPLAVEYSYNNLIERLDAQVDLVRLVGMDTLVHAADQVQLKFNLAVVIVPGMNITDLKADINTNLFAWIQRKTFQNNIQIADLIDVVSDSAGVDNVRLARSSEARSEVQKVTVISTVDTPSTTRDLFTLTIGDVESGDIVYNDSATDVRETLEAMPNIQEGNTFATQMNGGINASTTSVQVDDNPGLHPGGDSGGNPVLQVYFIQIESEIMKVTNVVDSGGTLDFTVKRAQLGTTAASHLDNTNVHVLGDVGVSKTTDGDDNSVYTISFLINRYSGVDNWGNRDLDLIVASKASGNAKLSFVVEEKVSGSGWGIQQIAPNDMTIMDDFTTLSDIYLDSDELPSVFGVDVILKAQNTF